MERLSKAAAASEERAAQKNAEAVAAYVEAVERFFILFFLKNPEAACGAWQMAMGFPKGKAAPWERSYSAFPAFSVPEGKKRAKFNEGMVSHYVGLFCERFAEECGCQRLAPYCERSEMVEAADGEAWAATFRDLREKCWAMVEGNAEVEGNPKYQLSKQETLFRAENGDVMLSSTRVKTWRENLMVSRTIAYDL